MHELEEQVIKKLRLGAITGCPYTPTKKERSALIYDELEYWITTPWPEKVDKKIYAEYGVEEKALGWLSIDEHSEGLLGKACPVCKYKYGNGWHTEAIPQSVVDYLNKLPAAAGCPAWL